MRLSKSQTARWALFALLAAALFFIGWFVAATMAEFGKITDDNPPGSVDSIGGDSATPATGAFNILMIGTDKGDTLTDTMMLMRVDLDTKRVNLLSLMRDTRVKLGSGYNKLNSVYARDDMDGLIKCIKELTGSPIHYYAMVDLAGFETIVDVLGGVEFNVPQNMEYNDPYQNLKINLQKGEQHLNGNQAMQLVRFRRYAEGDVQRTRVQQDFVKAVIEQKLRPEYLLKLPELFREIAPYVSTNVALSDVLSKASALKLFTAEDAVQIHELPGMGAYVGNISYFLHDGAATYELCKEHFGGTGAPVQRLYTDYSSAAPMNPGGGPPQTEPTTEPEPEEPEEGEEHLNGPDALTLPEQPDPSELLLPTDSALPASAGVSTTAPAEGTEPSNLSDDGDALPDNGLF